MKTPVPHAEVRVDLAAVRDNVAELRRREADAELLAVVKADGYGHGLVPSARAALAGGASWLGTAVLAEALQLRAAGVPGRILAWLAAPGERWDDRAKPMLDYFLTFEESFNRFPGFNYEVQGVFQEQVNGRIKFHTYVVRE